MRNASDHERPLENPAPDEAARCRRGLLGRVERWRVELSTLQVAIISTGPRARVSLSRDLEALVAECDHLTTTLDELATAGDGLIWHTIRARAEREWSDLVYRTRRLRQKIRRAQRFRSPNNRSRHDRPSAGAASGGPVSMAMTAFPPAAPSGVAPEPVPSERHSAALLEGPGFRNRRLRLWSTMLDWWAVLIRSEGAKLAAVRYRLIAELEDRRGRPTRSDRGYRTGPRIPPRRTEELPGAFVFAGHSPIHW